LQQTHADKLSASNQQIKRDNGITLQQGDYTDRLGVMAQKAEKMLLKMISE